RGGSRRPPGGRPGTRGLRTHDTPLVVLVRTRRHHGSELPGPPPARTPDPDRPAAPAGGDHGSLRGRTPENRVHAATARRPPGSGSGDPGDLHDRLRAGSPPGGAVRPRLGLVPGGRGQRGRDPRLRPLPPDTPPPLPRRRAMTRETADSRTSGRQQIGRASGREGR